VKAQSLTTAALSLLLIFALTSVATGHELSGYISADAWFFPNDPLFPGQEQNNASLAIQPEYYHEWESGSSFIFIPFARLDGADPERTHFDIRELNYLWVTDSLELRLGVGKVFWGVTEFVHLVDIINQIDSVESIDYEDRLGQPMVHLSVPRDWGVVEMFVLPYFRERTFPGRKGRLRYSLVIDTDKAVYESADKNYHTDFAIRYSHSIGAWDIGISNFNGTGREPTIRLNYNNRGEPVLIPFYEQINQTSLELQLVEGRWLFKFEGLYRTGQEDAFFAATGGFEYTFVDIAETGMDLGVIGEWAYDQRGEAALTPFSNDVILGMRLNVNDAAGSELLAGLVSKMDNPSGAVVVEAGHRLGDNWKLTMEIYAFFNQRKKDLFYSLRNDDFFRFELIYYY